MKNRWRPYQTPLGPVVSASTPRDSGAFKILTPRRAVVLQVYPYDESGEQSAVYCSVLTYGTERHARNAVLPRVLVTYGGGSGIHDGDIHLPRPSSQTLQSSLDISGISVTELDGDHVVIAFLDGDPALPYLQTYLPHPNAEARGIDGGEAWGSQRLRPVNADAQITDGVRRWAPPRGTRHHGGFFGISSEGDFEVNLQEAHSGVLGEALEAPGKGGPALSTDGSEGNIRFRIRDGSIYELSIGGATLRLEGAEGDAMLTLGNGAVSVAVSDHLQSLYDQLKQQFDLFVAEFNSHTHVVAGSATAPVAPPSTAAAPPWDPKIRSNKITIPDD